MIAFMTRGCGCGNAKQISWRGESVSEPTEPGIPAIPFLTHFHGVSATYTVIDQNGVVTPLGWDQPGSTVLGVSNMVKRVIIYDPPIAIGIDNVPFVDRQVLLFAVANELTVAEAGDPLLTDGRFHPIPQQAADSLHAPWGFDLFAAGASYPVGKVLLDGASGMGYICQLEAVGLAAPRAPEMLRYSLARNTLRVSIAGYTGVQYRKWREITSWQGDGFTADQEAALGPMTGEIVRAFDASSGEVICTELTVAGSGTIPPASMGSIAGQIPTLYPDWPSLREPHFSNAASNNVVWTGYEGTATEQIFSFKWVSGLVNRPTVSWTQRVVLEE